MDFVGPVLEVKKLFGLIRGDWWLIGMMSEGPRAAMAPWTPKLHSMPRVVSIMFGRCVDSRIFFGLRLIEIVEPRTQGIEG